MGFGDAEVGQQQSHWFGFHRRAAIGVDGELAGRDELLAAGMFDQTLGQFGAFAIGDHPAHDETAEDIQDDIEVIAGPFRRAAQFGDVPTPQLVGLGGQQFRLLIRRMSELIAAFAAFATRFQQAIHGADRAMKPAFIEQCRVDLRGRAILKTLLMKTRQHGCCSASVKAPEAKTAGSGRRPGKKTAAAPPVPSGARNCQCLAGWFHAHQRAELIHRGHHDFSVSAIGWPNSLATFF